MALVVPQWDSRLIYDYGDQVLYASNLYTSAQNFNLNRVPSAFNTAWWVLITPPGGISNIFAGTNITKTGPIATPTLSASAVSPSPIGSYVWPSAVSVDDYGRVTAAAAGNPVVALGSGTGTSAVSYPAPSGGGTIYQVNLVNSGVTAGTYAYPTSVSVDARGRTTAMTGGLQPVTAVNSTAPLTTALASGSLSMAMDIDDNDLSTTSGPIAGQLSLQTLPGAAGTFAYPTSMTVDSKGRATAVSAGTQPVGSVTAGTGITVTGTTAPTVALTTLSPSPAGTYDALAGLTINAQGQVTSATAGSVGTNIGDYLYWDTATSRWVTGTTRIKLGSNAGATSQGNNAVAIGTSAGNSTQSIGAVAIGNNAGASNQGTGAIAIGNGAGSTNAGSNSITIGASAGGVNAGQGSVAIGLSTTANGAGSVAIGISAGVGAADSVSVGGRAGQVTQATQAVAVGAYAGAAGQSTQAVSVGAYSSSLTQSGQGAGAVSVGFNAAQSLQGANAIAIGRNAVAANQGARSIVLNATNNPVSATATDQTIITPLRTTATAGYASDVIAYRSNGELITTPNRFTVGGDLSLAGNAIDTSFATGLPLTGGTLLSGSAGGTSGQHLQVNVNGAPYKIKLELP